MLRIGLTGGIGAGKSTVAHRLAELGAVVIDADRLAREVVEPGTDGLGAVARAFGDGVLTADGSLDRAALGARVFADEEARRTLNGILHPRIAALTAERLAVLPPDAIVVHDVPLLVENRMGDAYHLVLVVHAPVEERIRRLVAGRGMAGSDARSRVASQADDDARRAAADVLLDNAGAPGEVLAQVDRFWACRAVEFERNLRERRPASAGPRATVVPPDPEWAAQGARLAARIARALGERVVRVDHVGPTSVPGLAARDVIDLRAVVDGEIGDDITDRLASAGFFRAGFFGTGVNGTYRSVDPGRIAVLTVHPSMGPSGR